jgi:hypothetical protein
VGERPIIFGGESVRAILDGRKTVTRRVLKPAHFAPSKRRPTAGDIADCGRYGASRDGRPALFLAKYDGVSIGEPRCPHGRAGDHLWVREAIDATCGCDAEYMADGVRIVDGHPEKWDVWRDGRNLRGGVVSPIFMPRWASRLTLEILSVRVERLQEITPADVESEGVAADHEDDHLSHRSGACAVEAFERGWDELHAARGYSFASNPWVWRIEFRRVDPA